jgi:hypothetical protein
MPNELPIQMRDEDFRDCLNSLQRNGEGFRSIVYAFIVAYGTLMLWALNAIVYPIEQDRLGLLQKSAVDVLGCIPSAGEGLPTSDLCKNMLNNTAIGYLQSRAGSHDAPTVLKLENIEMEYLKQQIAYQYARSAQTAELTVPFVGISSDRNWLWLINVMIGIFLLYLIRDSLTNLQRLLHFLHTDSQKVARDDADQYVRTNLILMAQVITSARKRATNRKLDNLKCRFSLKVMVMLMIFSAPLLLSGLVVYDWVWFVYVNKEGMSDISGNINQNVFDFLWFLTSTLREPSHSGFISEPEFLGGIITMIIVVWEIKLILTISGLLGDLSCLNWNMQRLRNEVQSDV